MTKTSIITLIVIAIVLTAFFLLTFGPDSFGSDSPLLQALKNWTVPFYGESNYVRVLNHCEKNWHKSDEWIIEKEATPGEDGIKYKKCTACGYEFNREIIPATDSLGLEFRLNADGQSYTVVGRGTCTDSEIYIPAYHDGLKVTAIGEKAFSERNVNEHTLTYVRIPDGVTVIGSYAFWDCRYLVKVDMPDSVEKIKGSAFDFCQSLTDIKLSKNLKTIGEYAFCGCVALEALDIPEGVTSIRDHTFDYCEALREMWLPESLTEMGVGLFGACYELETVYIPKNITKIKNSTFHNCTSLKTVIMHDGISEIEDKAFFGCKSLVYISIPEAVTSIGRMAFQECTNLTYLFMGENLKMIEKWAFDQCPNLSCFYFSDTVTNPWNTIAIESYNPDLSSLNILYYHKSN